MSQDRFPATNVSHIKQPRTCTTYLSVVIVSTGFTVVGVSVVGVLVFAVVVEYVGETVVVVVAVVGADVDGCVLGLDGIGGRGTKVAGLTVLPEVGCLFWYSNEIQKHF